MPTRSNAASEPKVSLSLTGDRGQHVELSATPRLVDLLDLAAILNKDTSERFHYSFSALLLAFVYGAQPFSRWFSGFVRQQGIALEEILRYRGLTDEIIRSKIRSYSLPLGDPSDLYPDNRRTATSSVQAWISAAKHFSEQQGYDWLGLRHLMGAVIFSPQFHAEDLERWRFDRALWASSFLEFLQDEIPEDWKFWEGVRRQTFDPVLPGLTPADFKRLSSMVQHVLARADALRTREGKDRIYTEHLLAGLLQPGGPFDHIERTVPLDLGALLRQDFGVSSTPPVAISPFPLLSQHAAAALFAAREKADAEGSPYIEPTHLLTGVFSQTASGVVRQLNQLGVTEASLLGDTSAPSLPTGGEGGNVPFNVGEYDLSGGARAILDATAYAAEGQDSYLSTSLLLLTMAREGRVGRELTWAPDFLRDAMSGAPERLEALLDGLRSDTQNTASSENALSKYWERSMRPGLAWTLAKASDLAIATTSETRISARHLLAALLLEVPPPHSLGAQRILDDMGIHVPLLRERMYEWVRGYGDLDDRWRVLLIGQVGPEPRRKVEFSADTAAGLDLIGIEQDVLALATLITARDSSPPLSIGLFGDWGSGKSFFMHQLRQTVAEFSRQARTSGLMQRDLPFYKRVVQIEFNAWHYVEGNLWASMVEHILGNLSLPDDPQAIVTEELQKHLIEHLGFTERAKEEAVRKNQEATDRVMLAENDLEAATQEHEKKKLELQSLSVKNVSRNFRLSGATTIIHQSLEGLGIQPFGDAVEDLNAALRLAEQEVRGSLAVFTPLVHAKDKRRRWVWLIFILVAGPAAGAFIALLLSRVTRDQIGQIWGVATGASVFLTGVATWVRKQARWVSEQRRKVEEAQRAYDTELTKELAVTADKIAKTEQELALARQDYTLAQQRVERAKRDQETAQANLTSATTERLLGQFIQDRAASSDYRKHLGVLALVRQDFQKLSGLIDEENWRLSPTGIDEDRFAGKSVKKITTVEEEDLGAKTRINRIVLYIDDLDRCPPAKVVEVLQAVHLLLAFPLFVVVVGVDARWISRSLESRYRELLNVGHIGRSDEGDPATELFGVARSEDYLEKIFQIPLWLRRMDAGDAKRMVQSLLGKSFDPKKTPLRPTEPRRAAVTLETNVDTEPELGRPPAATSKTTIDEGVSIEQGQATGDTSIPASVVAPPLHRLVPNLESLEIRDFEIDTIDQLAPLLARSPRALKRFVNLYRLIKAGMTAAEHASFLRATNGRIAGFQAVLFLLAVDTGLPHISRLFFEQILKTPSHHTFGFESFLHTTSEQQSVEGPEWNLLKNWIEHAGQFEVWHGDISPLCLWVSRVARYSFQACEIDGSRELT